ncbi:g-patch domain-containing protein [Phthorimaea operculella]|nr:g-patch domain-containing protein [Phthorimaea operculella]
MDDLNTSLGQYNEQLAMVSEALAVAKDDNERQSLLALQSELKELIQLTQESVNALTNKDASSNGGSSQGVAKSEDKAELDDEYALFMKEMAQTGAYDSPDAAEPGCSKDASQNNDEDSDIEDELATLLGMKCAVYHTHKWGGQPSLHNAMVSSVEPRQEEDQFNDLQVRVLYTHPTHAEMLPCPFYLDGECRFSDEQCRYSHGTLVQLSNLKDAIEPNFDSIRIGSRVLLKLKPPDDEEISLKKKSAEKYFLWHRAVVKHVDLEKRTCIVKLEHGIKTGEKRKAGSGSDEIHVKFEEIFPLYTEDDSSDSDSSLSDTEYPESKATRCEDDENRTLLIEKSLEYNGPAMGEWERHTRNYSSDSDSSVSDTECPESKATRCEDDENRTLLIEKSLQYNGPAMGEWERHTRNYSSDSDSSLSDTEYPESKATRCDDDENRTLLIEKSLQYDGPAMGEWERHTRNYSFDSDSSVSDTEYPESKATRCEDDENRNLLIEKSLQYNGPAMGEWERHTRNYSSDSDSSVSDTEYPETKATRCDDDENRTLLIEKSLQYNGPAMGEWERHTRTNPESNATRCEDDENRNLLIEKSLQYNGPAMGEWERQTRGIGSKLMLAMGYVPGTGLGATGEGRVQPVEARIVPLGKSLDHCMALSERHHAQDPNKPVEARIVPLGKSLDHCMALSERHHAQDPNKVEQKLKRMQKKEEDRNKRAYEREKEKERRNVFNFLNRTLGDKTEETEGAIAPKIDIKQSSTKDLNIEQFKVTEDVRRVERDIVKLNSSLSRHAAGTPGHRNVNLQIMEKNKELSALRQKEDQLNKEQSHRKNKQKMTVF